MDWPRTSDELRGLAGLLLTLVGGRRDTAPRYYNFVPKGETEAVKGWAPWRGRCIPDDYQLGEGERDTRRDGRRHLLKPLDLEAVSLHLAGRERLGVYPIDDSEQVQFLAADFDDHDGTLPPEAVWREVKNFWEVCDGQEFIAHIERSKSGTGYHVWLFFDAPIPAAKARAIGRYLMEEAGTIDENEDFSTFDRFFPNQPYLTGKGFGNLIGLPMCGGKNYADGLNAWVNPETGETIGDGPAYLQDVMARGRNPAVEVDKALDDWGITDRIEKREDMPEFKERDGDEKLGTLQELETVIQRCAFMQWATAPENQPDVPEPLWYAMISNGSRFDADERLHDASCNHGGYSHKECQDKIAHTRRGHPVGCAVIKKDGFAGCPGNGCQMPDGRTVNSPAGLAYWINRRPSVDSYDPIRMPNDSSPVPDPFDGDQPLPPPPEADGPTVDDEPDEKPWSEEIPLYDCSGMPWPYVGEGWDISNDGLRMPARPIKDAKGKVVGMAEGDRIALRPIWVHAITKDMFGTRGAVIKFFDYDWVLETAFIPLRRLSEAGGKLGMELRDQGMPLVAGKEKWVCRYLDDSANSCIRRALTANKLGWFDAQKKPVFVLPETIIGDAENGSVFFQTNNQQDTACISFSGTLNSWIDRVAKPCTGNPLLMFAALCSLAGPFLKLCRGESAGFHFYGATSGGKTTLLQVAASVWGDGTDPQEGADHTSIRKWHSTGNALEATAQMHNDMVLCLDEVGQVEPGELGNIIYMLSGGQPKGRSQIEGGLKKQVTWRLLFLSNGEMTVGQILAQAGQAEKGGQRHRLPDIPCDNPYGDGSGVVINSQGKPVKPFVDDLKAACGEVFGVAGPALTGWLIGRIEREGFFPFSGRLRDQLSDLENKLREGIDLPNDGGRVVRRMAIVCLAGFYAAKAGVTPWTMDEVYNAVVHVRNLWLKELGDEVSEEDRALAYFRAQLLHNLALFRNIEHEGEIKDAIGLRGKGHIMPYTHSMKQLAGPFDQNMILKALLRDELLWAESGRLARKSPRIKGRQDRPRVYAIKDRFLGEPDSTIDDPWEQIHEPGF